MDTGGVIGGGGPGGRKPRIREIRSMPSAHFIKSPKLSVVSAVSVYLVVNASG